MAGTTGIVPFWKQYDRHAVLRFARLAEDLGYDSIWVPEAWAYEQFQLLTEIALATKTLKVATGIANVFSRSPGLLAMSAATLDEISGGRVILGLGTSGKTVVENFHGVAYERPLTRLCETIGIARAPFQARDDADPSRHPDLRRLPAREGDSCDRTPRRRLAADVLAV
jgi:alkanesulfonate monooxygenase SsuD/methylene tetrahydromethanopterin reductase-like flavin-dependent oxidoreductase (luciferase family)